MRILSFKLHLSETSVLPGNCLRIFLACEFHNAKIAYDINPSNLDMVTRCVSAIESNGLDIKPCHDGQKEANDASM